MLHPFQKGLEKTQEGGNYRILLRWRGIAVFQPVMNGVGGNLVAVQVDFTIIGIEEESNDDVYDDDGDGDDNDDDDHDDDHDYDDNDNWLLVVQASRLSTDLHCNPEGRLPGTLPQGEKVRDR